MQNSLTPRGNTVIPPEILDLFGPPPVITAAEAKMHETIFRRFAHTVQPCDAIEWVFVRDAADIQVEIQRYRRFKTDFFLQARRELLEAVTHDIDVGCSGAKEKER